MILVLELVLPIVMVGMVATATVAMGVPDLPQATAGLKILESAL